MCILFCIVLGGDHGFQVLQHDQGRRRFSETAQVIAQAAYVDRPAGEPGQLPGQFCAGHTVWYCIEHHAYLDAKAFDLLGRGFRRTGRFRFSGFRRSVDESEEILDGFAQDQGHQIGNSPVATLAVDGAMHGGEIAAQDSGDGLLINVLGGEFVFYGLR